MNEHSSVSIFCFEQKQGTPEGVYLVICTKKLIMP